MKKIVSVISLILQFIKVSGKWVLLRNWFS